MRHILVAAVDFGSYKISASLGSEANEELDILGSVCEKSKGIEKGLIVDEKKCSESLSRVITKLSEKTGEEITDIYVGVSSRNIRISEITASVNLKDGIVKKSDIKRALERCRRSADITDEEEIIDIAIEFYMLDGNIVYDQIIGWKGSTLELNTTVLISNKKQIEKYLNVCRESGLTLRGFKVNILSGKSIFLNGKSAMGVKALVDIGAGTTDIAIFSNGMLKNISSIPLGGENITKDIAICAKIPSLEAENIKKIYADQYETIHKDNSLDKEILVGTTKIDRELFYEVTKARIEEIINYVKIELKNTGYFEGICSIIIYGEGISCYENIDAVVNTHINAKNKVITGEDLGLKNVENITSLAIVKDAYDRLKLVCDNLDHIEERKTKEQYEHNKVNVKEKEKNLGFMNKLKSYFEEIF